MTERKKYYKIDRKICPRCKTPCKLRAISSYDPGGLEYGAMFICPSCGWDDWGHIIDPNEIVDFSYDKPKENNKNDK